MANMNKLDMLNVVRYLIDERLGTGVSDGTWGNTQLMFYIDQGMWDAYYDQINADNMSFLTTSTIAGDGSELYDLPNDFVKPHRLMVTSEMSSRSFITHHQISIMDRMSGVSVSNTNRVFYMAPNDQIGILPAPSVNLTLEYYKKFQVLDKEGVAYSDLHEMAQHLACLYAARTALANRGEGKVTLIDRLLAERKQQLNNIRRSSPEPFEVVPKRDCYSGRNFSRY